MPKKRARAAGVTFDDVRRLALALPEVEESTSYGTPAFKVRKKLIARLREDGESLVVMIDKDTRATLMGADPAVFHITDHYRDYPAMLVRLSRVDRETLRGLLEDSWRRQAPKRLLAATARS